MQDAKQAWSENKSVLFNTRISFSFSIPEIFMQRFRCRIQDLQHDIGLLNFFMCPVDTELFDPVRSMRTDTGRINQPEFDAFNRQHFFNGIARGAGNLTHDGALFIQQTIQQGRLARIGFADNRHLHPVTDHIAVLK